MPVRAAEIGGRRVLPSLDDAAAYGSGAGEMLEQRLAVAFPDRFGQRRDVLVEAAEHLKHAVLVGEEDVAPHGWIRGGDAGEVAEATGRKLEHLRARHGL